MFGSRPYKFCRFFTACKNPLTQPHCSEPLEQIRSLCARGNVHEAITLFYRLDLAAVQTYVSNNIYGTLFGACARHSLLQQGCSLHRHLLSRRGTRMLDLFVANHLINMYAKCGCMDNARNLFDEMPYRNIVTWSVLISGYAQNVMGDECFCLFADMLRHCRPTEFALASVLSSCCWEYGVQVHALALKIRYDAFVYVGNALLTMYFKSFRECDATKTFETMKFQNLISWNSMIAGLQGCGLWKKAVGLFNQMHFQGIGSDRATILSVFTSLCGNDDNLGELGLIYCCQFHALTEKMGFMSEIEVVTALVKCYSYNGGEAIDCYKLFLQTAGDCDIVLWTAIMTVFVERDPIRVLLLFRQLLQEGVVPDIFTFSVVLKGSAGFPTERHTLCIHSQVIKSGFEIDMVLCNVSIHAYARCGCIALSKKVFDEMNTRDTISWNSMLKAYALYGQARDSLNLFLQMSAPPDGATLVAVLSACGHAGLVEEGSMLFETMYETFGIAPQVDHLACIVDLLGRAGHIPQALNLIAKTHIKADYVVWSSLLAACRQHGDSSTAQMAAIKVQELDPTRSLGYVQLSNIYCSDGSFGEADLIRNKMIIHRVRKEPGLSWTEVNNQVHEFASGGHRHPQKEAIYLYMEGVIKKMKEMGYAADTSGALHDIENEHKEEQLYHHSEKLAFVFILMSEANIGSAKKAIKIMKNLRICLDCHNFMKIASHVYQREIIVRDSNRFHHFIEQACSCNDYW